MQNDPALEWRRLAEHYRAMGDVELEELAADFADLTDTAQNALRGEMQSRGLSDPQNAGHTAPVPAFAPKSSEEPWQGNNAGGDPHSGFSQQASFFGARQPQQVSDSENSDAAKDGPHEYTWKDYLCECETQQHALELRQALMQAGIDAWIQSYGLVYPRVLVAADQLDQARAVAAQPIPQEIVDALREEVPEFTVPACPKCGSSDPTLEGVDPTNLWRCEQCGEEWSDKSENAESRAEGDPDEAQ